MPKEKVKKMTGLLAAVFAHTGHISKEEAKEISGLDDHHFEQVYEKASRVAEHMMDAEGAKMDKFMKHFGEELEEYVKEFGSAFVKF